MVARRAGDARRSDGGDPLGGRRVRERGVRLGGLDQGHDGKDSPDGVVRRWRERRPDEAVQVEGVAQSGFVPLPINLVHAAVAGELTPHHRDPFDRMLVAQARVERLTLVSHDRRLEPYGAAIIWA